MKPTLSPTFGPAGTISCAGGSGSASAGGSANGAVEAGALLDLSATVSVRTPGHPASGHLAGWHLWYRADPGRPVHLGPLARCHSIELRTRGTCPGSPGYAICAHPDELPVLPHWIAALAGPPPAPATTITGSSE